MADSEPPQRRFSKRLQAAQLQKERNHLGRIPAPNEEPDLMIFEEPEDFEGEQIENVSEPLREDSDHQSQKSRQSRNSKSSRKSRTSTANASTASSQRRRLRAEAEMDAAEAETKLALERVEKEAAIKAQLELEKLEKTSDIQKNLIAKKKELRLAQIDEEDEESLHDLYSNDSQRLSEDEEDRNYRGNSKPESVKKWLKETVHPAASSYEPMKRITAHWKPHEIPKETEKICTPYQQHDQQNQIDTMPEPAATGGKGWEKGLEEVTNLFKMQMLTRDSSFSFGTSDRKQDSARRTIGRKAPTFSGKPEEWPAFLNMFEEATRLCGFTESENLMRLQEGLKGEARDVVQGLFNASENVPAILKTLRLRFGKPDLIVKALVAKARKFPTLREYEYDKIVSFGTAVNNLATTAKALKCNEHLLNPTLRDELVDRLPSTMKVNWGVYQMTSQISKPSIVDLSDWLNFMVEAISNVYTPKTGEEKAKEATPKPKDRFKKKEGVFAVASEDSDSTKKPVKVRKCLWCETDGHGLWECKTFVKKTEVNERWDFVKSKKLCFGCLIYGHQTDKCQFKKKCGKDGCIQHHHPCLHNEKKPQVSREEKKSKTEEKPKSSDEEKQAAAPKQVLHASNNNEKRVLHKIVPVLLQGPNKCIKSYALLDEGSSYTMIDSAMAEELELDGPKRPLVYSVAGNNEMRDEDSKVVQLQIRGIDNKHSYELSGVRTKNCLGMPRQTIGRNGSPMKWAELNGVELESMRDAKPSILIGLDHGHLLATEELKRGPNNSWLLGKTWLGWALYGNTGNSRPRNEDGFMLCQFDKHDEALHQLVKESFSTDAFGVKVLQEKVRSKDDERAVAVMESTTKRVGKFWETGLIWKNDNIVLPDSKSTAMRRLETMERKMDKSEQFATEYLDKIKYYVEAGYARYLTSSEATVTTPKTWYLPHFGVINPNKPGKMRFVFDAAAKSRGVSLNDFLLPGPDLLVSLPGTLIKFRQRKIGFSGDIKEFFHRTHVRPADQDSQRFLFRGMDRDRDPDILVMQVNIFGATCAPFTSQAAKVKNAGEFKEEFPEAATAIITRHYMDDYLDSTDTVQEAVKVIHDVIEVHRRGDLEIGKFISSSKEVLKKIPKSSVESNNSEIVNFGGEMSTERILGLSWNPNCDTLGFNLKFHKVKKEVFSGEAAPTKREVLKVVMSVFDPLGLLGHYTVQGKILLQDIWRSGIDWDDKLNDDLDKKWQRWIGQLESVGNLKIPRCYAPEFGENATRQLHIFCDASAQAFAAVAYIRSECDDKITTSVVMAKTRVAPLKPMSIPKLELQAALMGTRLVTFIKAEMEVSIAEVHFWTDSMTVIRWLRSDARNYKVFVAHRIGEILESTDVADWHWVPGKLNPADDATRDEKPSDLSSISRWVLGPEFLSKSKEEWPQQDHENLNQPCQEEIEMKQSLVGLVSGDATAPLPDVSRFSSWMRLIASTAFVSRSASKFLMLIGKPKLPGVTTNGCHATTDLEQAEKQWIRHVQATAFGTELDMLKKKVPVGRRSRLSGLSPILDEEGILRIDGRTKLATELTEAAKCPIILPPDHKYTKLLIAHYHRKAGHHGRERVLNDLRGKYWIIDGRNAVKKSWATCQLCKNASAKPAVPEMGQLPLTRLTPSVRPFTFCGVDYFGPMEVTIGRRHEKRYGVLFTCLTMRAVHLELAASLSTDSCIMALRRFMSRRGSPRELWSDNGTNFHGANNELQLALKDLDQEQITSELSQRGVDWHFIPPAAPHMGGCWERMVQSVKTALKATLKERAPKEEVLQTLFAETEFTVNSRPLTHVSADPLDPRALTPNDLLIGNGSTSLPPGRFTDADYMTRKIWRYSQNLADNFWRRWIREYMPTLTRRTKWNQRAEPIEIANIAVMVDDALERNRWPLGKIVNVFPGKDGQVRVVEIQTQNGVYKRPVAKIAVLDLKKGVDPADATPGGGMSSTENE